MCLEINRLCEKAVCIEDFCGTMHWQEPVACSGPIQYWADWCPTDKAVHFGGAWGDVPSMPSETQPEDEIVYEWAERHDGFWYRDSDRYFLASEQTV